MTPTFPGMNVLVTGGAGYVGSHTVKRLRDAGHQPVIYDGLVRGHRAVASILEVPAIYADIGDTERLVDALRANRIDCVMHFAALSEVGESVRRPRAYYRNNVAGTVDLLAAMERAEVSRLIFSSTCAIYGAPVRLPISENDEKSPLSPYAAGKLMAERIIEDHARSRPEFSYVILRYVNAAGASGDGTLGEVHTPETHLVPLLVRAALDGTPVTINGSSHATPDGTAVRDYVHVDDIAKAHCQALAILGPSSRQAINLGTGRGVSVLEMIRAAEMVTGQGIARNAGPPRAGDPAAICASGALAAEILGWEPSHSSPERIIETALAWFQAHPDGYPKAAV